MPMIEIDIDKCNEYYIDANMYCYLMCIQQGLDIPNIMDSTYYEDKALDLGFLNNINPLMLGEKMISMMQSTDISKVNAYEFIELFPSVVSYAGKKRAIRPVNRESANYKKLVHDYLGKVKKLKKHIEILEYTKVFVQNEISNSNGFYIPLVATIINSSRWDTWEGLVDFEDDSIIDSQDNFKAL